ncbi:Sensor histidine kinase LiaS [compost metagenome]
MSHEEQVKEEERKRIAREIHDQLGQSLLALRMDVSMLQDRIATLQPELFETASDALNHIDTTIGSVRGIINDLRPPVLDLGLQAALEWQLEEFRLRTGTDCQMRVRDASLRDELDDQRATTLFRIVQESLSNITRHARATQVMIELFEEGRCLHLHVSDNGVGIADQGKRNAFGLAGMKERVSMLGGEFRVESVPGNGTLLAIVMPLD